MYCCYRVAYLKPPTPLVTGVAFMLAAHESSEITGAEINCDGGLLAAPAGIPCQSIARHSVDGQNRRLKKTALKH